MPVHIDTRYLEGGQIHRLPNHWNSCGLLAAKFGYRPVIAFCLNHPSSPVHGHCRDARSREIGEIGDTHHSLISITVKINALSRLRGPKFMGVLDSILAVAIHCSDTA